MKVIDLTTLCLVLVVGCVGSAAVCGQVKQATPDPYFGSTKKTTSSEKSSLRQASWSGTADEIEQSGNFGASKAGGSQSRGSILKQPNPGSGSKPAEGHERFRAGKVLALVGGDPIFVGDLMFQINQAIETKIPNAPPEVKEQQRQLAIPQILPQFVQSKLLYIAALRELPDEIDLDQVFESVESQFDERALPEMLESSGVKDTIEFDAQLRGQDYSLRQLRRSWAIQQFTRHSVGTKLADISEITHQEMLDRYQRDISDYDRPARAKWEQVMVSFSKYATKDEVRRKIVSMGNKIVNGANFQALARQDSDGFRAARGGQHDWTTKGALALKPIDSAIFSLPPNELSDIIETRQGLHIVRVVEREDAARVPFLEAQIEIKKQLEAEKREAKFEEYNEKLRREIPVEYLTNE